MGIKLKSGALLNKRYEVIRKLGQGDFGVVYQACDQQVSEIENYVAIKQMPMQMIVNCERQADLRATLVHPVIPQILDYFSDHQNSYLVQEFICGSNLEAILNQHSGFLPENRVTHWAIQLCDALDLLHNHAHNPMIFRDLKPNNVMVDQDDRVYLVDFGLAKVFPPGYFDAGQTEFQHYQKGLAIGTEGYSPPEQYQGMVKPQSDIFALGASLHHLLTKRDPRKEPPFTFQQVPVRSINLNVSHRLEGIVMRAVECDLEARFSTAKEMRLALQNLHN